jgi:hypothetical protein
VDDLGDGLLRDLLDQSLCLLQSLHLFGRVETTPTRTRSPRYRGTDRHRLLLLLDGLNQRCRNRRDQPRWTLGYLLDRLA